MQTSAQQKERRELKSTSPVTALSPSAEPLLMILSHQAAAVPSISAVAGPDRVQSPDKNDANALSPRIQTSACQLDSPTRSAAFAAVDFSASRSPCRRTFSFSIAWFSCVDLCTLSG